MPGRLTDAQARNAREQALRAVRRAQRKLDTRVEILERRLDRSIENKEKITMKTAIGVVDEFSELVRLLRGLETAIADMGIVFSIITA